MKIKDWIKNAYKPKKNNPIIFGLFWKEFVNFAKEQHGIDVTSEDIEKVFMILAEDPHCTHAKMELMDICVSSLKEEKDYSKLS